MGIKKILGICVVSAALNMISAMPVVCVEAGSQDPVYASQGRNAIRAGMSKEDLFKIYHRGDVEKYERKDNEEVLVFDDTVTSGQDDTITFYLVDGKVKSWDKNKVIFPTDDVLKSAIHADMSKKDLLNIYYIGNLKAYTRSGNTEVATFSDILTSDPDDTITFYLVDGKVRSWGKKAAVPDADARSKADADADAILSKARSDLEAGLQAEYDADAESRAKYDADSKLKARADVDAVMAKAKADLDARIKATEERSRYDNSAQTYPTFYDDLMRDKQQERRSSVRPNNWRYDGGLYYR